MKVLLDENLPHQLRRTIVGHEVMTVAYMGWSGIKNGQLLGLAEAGRFEVFITADRSIPDQQNFQGRTIAMVYLTAQNWEVMLPHIQDIVLAVDRAVSGSFEVVDCGKFAR